MNSSAFDCKSLDNHWIHDLGRRDCPPDQISVILEALRECPDACAIEVIIDRLSHQQDPPWFRVELVTTLIVVALQTDARTSAMYDILRSIFTSDGNDEIRSTAALGLGQLGMLGASEALLEVLRSGYSGLLAACIMALGDLGVPEAVDLVAVHLESDRPLIPQMAAQALGRIGRPAAKLVPALRRLAKHGNKAERRLAAEAIAKILRG